ncbi:class I SAM-dependent methyltransferase [Paenibacillus pinisoli]|uniref:Class I SAM-dependent methyltransferase n=1 Tax=Paenibacillus pinisoli TaxID=1276110 RepID=A0A3A6PW66_9BACL|nr:class I SAM-dependent methyltransferase [Paenibacillus pinisoli]RJX38104.1 class I SAM-dependent methyltransferase [Paenibacillus pinisoli]
MDKERRVRLFDKQADMYDRRRGDSSQERFRRGLLSHAEGDVLELAVGAGANFPYYPSGVRVTAADFSGMMLEKAKAAAGRYNIDVSFLQADIDELQFPEHGFDTVISTLSLCSYVNPQQVVAKMKRWCKPGGQILLMELGISSNGVLAALQKTLNPLLYRLHGCHHTRNMEELVKGAGLHIVHMERHWLKMLYLIHARPSG